MLGGRKGSFVILNHNYKKARAQVRDQKFPFSCNAGVLFLPGKENRLVC